MTAAAKPGRREGGGTLDCRTRVLVLKEGGATRAAAIATWALVCARGDVLFGVAALRSLTIRRFRMRSHLAGTCTLRTRDMLGVCTPGTRWILWVVEDVATSAKRSGCACTWAFVASMIRWRSWAA